MIKGNVLLFSRSQNARFYFEKPHLIYVSEQELLIEGDGQQVKRKTMRGYCALMIWLASCSCVNIHAAAIELTTAPKEKEIVVASEEAPAKPKDSQSWPDIYEVQLRVQEYEDKAAREPLVFQVYTEEDLDSLFGNLPRCLESGSFSMNALHHLPVFRNDGLPLASPDGNYVIVRPSWGSLREEIASMLAEYQGDWSVYIKDLSTGQTMEINEHSMESASLIKLFIAGAVYEQIDLGNLAESDTVMSSLDAMITVSDNESSNVLVRAMCNEDEDFQVGLAKVNDFIARHGFTNTQQVNGIADPTLWVADGRVNMTSAADCGRLLEMVYDRSLVSHFNSYRFEILLNRQEVNYKIPEGLPEGVHISHKTGEVDDTENDAAIIYTPYGDYIFCIMSTDLTDTDAAVEHIWKITDLVYDYFTSYAVPRDAALDQWQGTKSEATSREE